VPVTVPSPVGPGEVWGAWTFDPLVVAGLLVGAALSARGYTRTRGRGRAAASRAASFAAALVTIAVALVSPLDAMAETLFSAHMVQHLLLIVVAPPLLVVSRPVVTILAGLPRGPRRSLARIGRDLSHGGLGRALRRPAVAWCAFAGSLWVWHLPVLYRAAVLDPGLHALEHAIFLGTSALTWSVALSSRTGGELGALGRALFLLSCAVQSGLLGALLLLAPRPLYPVHGAGPALWGLTPLSDQQLAGAIMWIPPSGIYLAVAAGILVRWFRSMDARTSAEPARTEVAT
jgi:putative membrane protein